jgi:hypothetical protein
MIDLAEWFKWPKNTRYEGQMIDSTPDSYLKWAINNWDDEDVVMACDEEMEWRIASNQHIYDND